MTLYMYSTVLVHVHIHVYIYNVVNFQAISTYTKYRYVHVERTHELCEVMCDLIRVERQRSRQRALIKSLQALIASLQTDENFTFSMKENLSHTVQMLADDFCQN